MNAFNQIEDVCALRAKLGLNQNEFWSCVSVDQSNGSRYENKRSRMPKTVCALVSLIYINGFNSTILKFDMVEDVRALRKKLGLHQADFWAQVGVTQSGGSHYELGRKMPKPLCALVYLVHTEGLDLKTLKFNQSKSKK